MSAGSKAVCPVCKRESEKSYRCSRDDCPKGPFGASERSGRDRR